MIILEIIRLRKGKRFKKEKNFETKLIRLISLLLAILFLSVIILYYSSMKSMYSEQLEKSNDRILQQVAISFEMIMQQITEGIYKLPLYDKEIIQLISSENQDIFYQIELQRKLDSVVLGNNYLYSAYLYLPEHNVVYSSETANRYPLEKFPDFKAIVLKSTGTISISDPRIVISNNNEKNLLISVVCPLPLYQGEYKGLLLVNIDANKIFYNVLRRIEADESMNFYVYNRDRAIIISKDEAMVFGSPAPEEKSGGERFNFSDLYKGLTQNEVVHSSYYSNSLNWSFVLDTSIKSTSNLFSKLYSIGLTLIILLLAGLLIVIWIIKMSAKPMKKALSSYNEKLWIDFLSGNSSDSEELYKQLEPGTAHFKDDHYATVVLQLVKADHLPNGFKAGLAGIKSTLDAMNPSYNTITLANHKNQITVIVNFKNNKPEGLEASLFMFAQRLYERLNPEIKPLTYISISTPKELVQMLPVCYRECIEALNYKIANGSSHILQYNQISRTASEQPYEYPLELERQLINNLLIGNPDSCMAFLEKFFISLADTQFQLSDSEIKNCIYQLQTSILRSISNLPITIKIDNSINILHLFDFDEIKTNVSSFVLHAASEIKKSSEDENSNLLRSIFDYIDKNFMDMDFNLNGAADELGLNRNYLTKLVKEKSGDSFNEYVTKKRIALAKTLLQNKNTPIEEIAHKTGFNYSHYFIKVFKGQEGITPGQYRDRVLDASASLTSLGK